jgi:TolB-like protein/DNA-binding winged helix-turn-helix (wHTH) protein/lipopolysaccharide biosynthesis regulator YciM
MKAPPSSAVYEFGDFQMEVRERLLRRRGGAAIPLRPRVFDTLLFLVQHSGTVLDKERLMEAVWPDSIVEENNLSQNISTLRRVLGESPGSGRFIVTVPGRGYRFAADVKIPEETPIEANGAASSRPESATEVRAGDTNKGFAAHRNGDALVAQTHGDIVRAQSSTREEAADDARSSRGPTGRRLRLLIASVSGFALGLAVLIFWRSPQQDPATAPIRPERSIAVLPFENLSDGKDEAFFADGFQDDLLTSIGKIKNLRVIAQPSVARYRAPAVAGKMSEIGEALGVTHLLRGSVRRTGGRVVINASLIDVRDDRQLWSGRYDRTLTDALSLQGEVALEIARTLQATLTLEEQRGAAARPTDNPDAYVLYLRGRELDLRFNPSSEDLKAAGGFFQQAIDLDPSFALARARLSMLLSRMQGKDPVQKAKAKMEAEEALRLRPELGEARLAITYCYFWGERDYDRALQLLSHAAEALPNSPEVHLTAAYIYKWQNKFGERIAALQRAETLDPRDPHVLNLLISTLRWVRDWPEAIRARDRLSALLPTDSATGSQFGRAHDQFRMTGNIDFLRKANAIDASASTEVDGGRLNYWLFQAAMLERDYAAAERYLSRIAAGLFADKPHSKSVQEVFLAVARTADQGTVAQALGSACQEVETQVASLGSELSAAAFEARANLALLYAFLGRKEDAIRESRALIELQTGPIEKDTATALLALVYAQTGESEEAITLIERLLTVPVILQQPAIYDITLADLKWHWAWDPLRSNPRFQKILEGPEPKTVY